MRKYLLTAAFVVTSGAAFADYYVVQDTTSHRCSIVEQTPAGKNMVVVPGTKTYSSRDQAEAALKRADACNNATAERPAPRGQVRFLSSAPAGATSVTRLYKQNVYDANNAKIGEIDDILLTNDGRAVGLVIGVGGFLGIGETHVVVPMDAVHAMDRDGSIRLVMNTTKEEVRSAGHYRFEKSKYVWVPVERNSPPRK